MNIKQKQRLDKLAGYLLIALFLPLTRLLGISLKRDHTIGKGPDTILFIKILGLGSLVMATGLIKASQNKYPQANIILLTDRNLADGIRPFLPGIEIWVINASQPLDVLVMPLALMLKAWQSGLLWVCDLEVYSKLTTVFSLFTCAANRFGFVLHPVQFRKYLNTHNVYYNIFQNMEMNYAAMAASMGAGLDEAEVHGRTDHRKGYLAINNTCSELSVYRQMPEQTLLELIAWILTHTTYKIALCGAPGDFGANEHVIQKNTVPCAPERLLNIASKFDFPGYYRFLAHDCALMLSIDSAPLHIAKKLGLPTLSVWGPTNPRSYLHIRENEKEMHLTCYKAVVCSPCVHHTDKLPCNGNNFCMKDFSAAEIIEQLKALEKNMENHG